MSFDDVSAGDLASGSDSRLSLPIGGSAASPQAGPSTEPQATRPDVPAQNPADQAAEPSAQTGPSTEPERTCPGTPAPDAPEQAAGPSVPVSSAGERLSLACELPAGLALGQALLQIDVTALSADDAVTVAQQWERVVAYAIAAREQARADANAALVAAHAAEDARLAERDRLENAERAAIDLPPIPHRLGAGFVPPELAALNELGAALRMAPRTIDTAIARASELATPRITTAGTPCSHCQPDTCCGNCTATNAVTAGTPCLRCQPDTCCGACTAPGPCTSAPCCPGCTLSNDAPDATAPADGEVIAPWAPLLAAMAAGELTEQHVQAIGRWLRLLPAAGRPTERAAYVEQCARVLDVVIPYAVTHTPGEAGRKTKVLVLTADPAGARERRRKDAENHHCVQLTPTEPGTCELLATMPIAHGEAIMSAINGLAKDTRFETAPGCVTKGQRQVAALTTLVLGDPGTITHIDSPVSEAKLNAHISVIVPLDTITAARKAFGLATDNTGAAVTGSAACTAFGLATTGAARASGSLAALGREATSGSAGAGSATGRADAAAFGTVDALPGGRIGTEPVPADLVREVIADAATDSTLRRLVTDATGTVIDIGRAHYTPTGLQQRLIRMRDGVCRFPGCTTRAEHAEIDHAIAWDAGGLTDLANLGVLCKRHHQAKTHGGWNITHSNQRGACTWQSPLGRIYHHEPEPLVPPPAPPPAEEKPPF